MSSPYNQTLILVFVLDNKVGLTGKHEGRKVVTVEAKAFRTAFAPYGNQAHHLLPDAELRHGIVKITKPAPQVKDVICQGLLNVNPIVA